MKKIIMILIVLLSFSISNIFAAGTEYASKQMDGCTPTGYTTVFELEWISQDTLQVTVSERSSNQNDGIYLYNLTSYTPYFNGNSCSISGGINTKLLPFDDPSQTEKSDEYEFTCLCNGEIDLVCCAIQGDQYLISCLEEGCCECCKGALVPKGSGSSYAGGGIVVDAQVVIFVSTE